MRVLADTENTLIMHSVQDYVLTFLTIPLLIQFGISVTSEVSSCATALLH